MDPKEAKDVLRDNPPNIPEGHWETLIHNAVIDDKVIDGTVTLTNEIVDMTLEVNAMTGEATVTMKTTTIIEAVNAVLRRHNLPMTGWEVKK